MSDQTVIITGARGGIGSTVAGTFRDAGWKLALIAHNATSAAALAKHYPGVCVATADLADASSAQRAITTIVEQSGPVDALLNIAGGFTMVPAADTTAAQLEAQLDINLRTAFNATRAVLPHMLKHGHGFILGVGSAPAITGGAQMGPYAASKAALIAWLKCVHAELAGQGISTAIVYPMGAVDTAGNRAAMPDVDPASLIDPVELAQTMLHLATRTQRGQIREARVYPPA